MTLSNGLAERAIKDVVTEHPAIGVILAEHDIGCATCGVGICLLKDVVSIHGLPADAEQAIEREINHYLEHLPCGREEN